MVWGGFLLGLLFGFVAQRVEFCLSGGLKEWLVEKRPARAGAFLFAMAVAVAGTQAAVGLGWVDLRESLYWQPGFSWLLIPLGGVLFGYGMIMARGCGSRALVLLADGNLRSLLVLLCLGISAHLTLTGLIARPRIALTEATTAVVDFVHSAALIESRGVPAGWSVIPGAILIAGGLTAFAFFWLGLAKAPRQAMGAALIGLLVPAGWMVTGRLGADDFDPVALESLTFVAPIGDSILYLMLSTGLSIGFGVTVVAGVLAGALAGSLFGREFELRGFENTPDALRAAGGGILMGAGGALSLGCSVGQGLSGLSTLAFSSILAVAGIFAGGVAALRGPLQVAKVPPVTNFR